MLDIAVWLGVEEICGDGDVDVACGRDEVYLEVIIARPFV